MNAYDENYLDDAMKNMGEAFDYAVNACGNSPDEFVQLFISTGVARYFGNGNPKYISGKSGTELVMDIMILADKHNEFPDALIEYDFSPEYWSGWVLAYYQWYTGKSFKEILSCVSMNDILKLYPTLHEASEDKFVDTLNSIIERRKSTTKLQNQRKIYGYSQKELSEKSGINLRTLQQYETGAKDIKKAAIETVSALAKTLGCSIEDIV